MDFERVQKLIESAQNLEDYTLMPPFFGKNKWTLDPTKIVTKSIKTTLPTIPEEEDIKEPPLEKSPKRVQFASYVEVHMRCPVIGKQIHYPSKMIEDQKHENDILKDDLLIAEKRIEQLESKLKLTQQMLSRARTINDTLPLWMLVLLFLSLVISYKYTQMNL